MSSPEPDADSAPFWAALRERRIVLQCCRECGRHRFPPVPACPYCGARPCTEVDVAGGGRVYSWIRVHRALTPAMADEVPYTVAVIELVAGPRLLARLDGRPAVRIGDRVEPRFVDHGDWTELRYA